jgi:CHAT domain-containing protein/Tfp pilus assembly protein PilF
MQQNRSIPAYDLRRIVARGILLGSLVAWAASLHVVARAVAQTTPAAQPEPLSLEPGKAIEREISGKNADLYEIALDAGQYAGINVEQRGIDVVVDVTDAGGKLLSEYDFESRIPGQEHVVLTAESAVRYQLSVKPKYSRATAGNYQIQIAEVRPSTEKDRLLFEMFKLNTESQALNRASKFDDARSLAVRALESGEKALGPNGGYLGEMLINLAELERTKDNMARAEELFQRAILVDLAAYGRESPQTAWAVQRLGVFYTSTGEYAKAEPLLQEALATTENTLGVDSPKLVLCLMNISHLHENREAYDQALPELQRARVIAEKQMEPEEFARIGVLNNLADLYVFTHRYDEAEPLTEIVIEMVEKTRGPEYPRLAEPLANLAVIAREKGQYQRALDLLQRAEAIREKAYGPRNSQTAATFISIGNVYRAEGDFARAIDNYQRARDVLETAAGPYHSLTLLTYVNAAIAYAAVGDIGHAVEYQTLSESILEKSIDLNVAIGSEHEKSQFLGSASERTDRTISMNALLAPDNPGATDLAALVLLQRKGRVLDAMSGSLAALRQRMSTDDQKLLDELNVTTAKLAKLALHGAGKTPTEEYQAQLASLGKQRETLEAEISRRSAEFRTQSQSVTLAAVQEAIPAQAALVEFASYRPFDPKADSNSHAYGEPHYIAYVFRRQGEVRWKELGSAKAIDDTVAALRAALRDPTRSDVQQLARGLDEKIMQPVRALSGNATQLLISPDGELNLIPFEALVDEDQRYLVERYSISYLTTGRDLLRLQVARENRSGPMIIADPTFGEPASGASGSDKSAAHKSGSGRLAPVELASTKAALPRASSHTSSLGQVGARRSVTTATDLSNVYFAPLAGTALEARAIKLQFPDAQLLTGRGATESAVKQVNAPSILHIATHGFFLADPNPRASVNSANDLRGVQANANVENPLLRSGLALAGANLSHTGSEKGILTALEASNLNLWGTKLVTLSACDTGVGEIRNGEGVYGLRRAFVLAGAESEVMSLWPVSDYATREVMTSYYKGLKRGLGRGEALRQTKLAMLKRKDRQHPFYWASFIQSGEWASLDGQRE